MFCLQRSRPYALSTEAKRKGGRVASGERWSVMIDV